MSKYLSVFSPNPRKYRPEKIPYLDTFHAVRYGISLCIQEKSHPIILSALFLAVHIQRWLACIQKGFKQYCTVYFPIKTYFARIDAQVGPSVLFWSLTGTPIVEQIYILLVTWLYDNIIHWYLSNNFCHSFARQYLAIF